MLLYPFIDDLILVLLLTFYITDSSNRGEITEFNFIWWEIPKSTWNTTQNRPTLYPLPWNVPFRFNLYWRRNSKLYWQWITQFCQNENGNVCFLLWLLLWSSMIGIQNYLNFKYLPMKKISKLESSIINNKNNFI